MDNEELKTSLFCASCKKAIEGEASCGMCITALKVHHMWDLEKLERVKKLIEEIINLAKLDSPNTYGRNWEVF